jgi:hypothetical protein
VKTRLLGRIWTSSLSLLTSIPAIATVVVIFVIPSLHAVVATVQPYGLCEETTRAPGFAAASAPGRP